GRGTRQTQPPKLPLSSPSATRARRVGPERSPFPTSAPRSRGADGWPPHCPQCRQVEPLVRGDEVDRNVAPDRIHHAEVEESVGAGRRLAQCGSFNVGDLETSHPSLPCFARARTCRL